MFPNMILGSAQQTFTTSKKYLHKYLHKLF